jgi:outer membrane protein OmpA-like peptidoglycan-associated protein/tetratricopeptide (TPR) repeat protein
MTRLRSVICLLFFILVSPALWAQKAVEWKKNGEKAFANGRWADALALLSQYQQEKPGDPAVLTKLGIVHYKLHHADKARQYLEYVAKQNPDSQDADLFLFLARTLHGQQEFERAIPAYKSFLRVCGEKHPLRAGTADQIRRCVSGMALQPNDNVALVENLGDRVNTPGDEFAPLLSPNHTNRLYFSAAREGNDGGRRNDAGLADSVAGHWCSDMFFTNQTTSGWDRAAPLGSLLNTPRHEVALSFAGKGQVLFYFRGFTLYSGDLFADSAGRKDEYAISPPTFVSPMKVEEGDCTPFFFNDTTLIFASRRAGGQGGLDLYITTFSNSAWTEPKNLGPTVNSPYDEASPFLARDGRTLYFSSNRTESTGGLDVFKTVFEDEKLAWQAPVNLGTPVNSPGDDVWFSLAADGRTAFFSSDRLESFGERDLYIVYFKEQMAEQGRTSQPATFFESEKLAANAKKAESEAKSAAIPALFYNSDKDVLSPDNLKVVEDAAALARQIPQAIALVTVHTDETGAAKFDLYYGIKRAELVGKTLTERGVPAGRVLLYSCGPNYPLARTIVDATPNPAAAALNRRIEISFAAVGEKLPMEITVQRPEVSELMAAPGAKFFDENSKGVSFRVEIATTRQILTNDALAMFSDLMIESQPGTGSYRYTAGLFKQHDKAVQLKKDLQKQGFAEATVVAFIDGVRISKAEAVGLLKKYPDLAAYIKG